MSNRDLGPAQALLMANPIGNLLTPLVTDKEDTVTGNPFENPMMAQSILKLTKSQTYFLKAFGRRTNCTNFGGIC